LLTRQQLTSRLTEFGIDPTTVFENHSHRSHHGGNEVVNVDEVTSRLEKMGVDATIITTIVAEITAAEGSGTPMTRSQLFARLQELGVVKPDNASQLSERTERIGRFAGRRR